MPFAKMLLADVRRERLLNDEGICLFERFGESHERLGVFPSRPITIAVNPAVAIESFFNLIAHRFVDGPRCIGLDASKVFC